MSTAGDAVTWDDITTFKDETGSWQEALRVVADIDDGEMAPHNELVEVVVGVCLDEHCESCDTVYAWGGPGTH